MVDFLFYNVLIFLIPIPILIILIGIVFLIRKKSKIGYTLISIGLIIIILQIVVLTIGFSLCTKMISEI